MPLGSLPHKVKSHSSPRLPSPITTTCHTAITASNLFLLILRRTLRLRRTSELLGAVLSLLALLSAGLLDLGCMPDPHESVVRLELLHRLNAVVDEGESSGLAAAVLCPHAEHVDLVFVRFVDLGQLGAQVVLGDVRAVRVQDIAVERRLSGQL